MVDTFRRSIRIVALGLNILSSKDIRGIVKRHSNCASPQRTEAPLIP
jgi:hypothetical protein